MRITRYKRGGDVRHLIDYTSATGEIPVGRIGYDDDAPETIEELWKQIRGYCGDLYGQPGISVREIRWSYPKEARTTDVAIIGKTPHWAGDIKAQLPRFSIGLRTTVNAETGEQVRQRVYPAGLEDLAKTVDELHAALVEFVRKGTSQLSLEFFQDADAEARNGLGLEPAERVSMSVVR